MLTKISRLRSAFIDSNLYISIKLRILSPYSNRLYMIKDWRYVILREIDFLKICWSIPWLSLLWRIRTWLCNKYSVLLHNQERSLNNGGKQGRLHNFTWNQFPIKNGIDRQIFNRKSISLIITMWRVRPWLCNKFYVLVVNWAIAWRPFTGCGVSLLVLGRGFQLCGVTCVCVSV